MIQTHRFKNDRTAVPAARRFALEALQGQGHSQETMDTVELMVSELATNCIRHTNSDFEIAIELGPGTVRVTASDDGSGEPVMQQASPADASGRGLAIVNMLSSSWGIEHRASGPGKTVWFTLTADVSPVSVGR